MDEHMRNFSLKKNQMGILALKDAIFKMETIAG